jgi:hypothetical protein
MELNTDLYFLKVSIGVQFSWICLSRRDKNCDLVTGSELIWKWNGPIQRRAIVELSCHYTSAARSNDNLTAWTNCAVSLGDNAQSSDKSQLRQNDHGCKYLPPLWQIFTTAVANNYHRGGKSGEKEIKFKRIKSYCIKKNNNNFFLNYCIKKNHK